MRIVDANVLLYAVNADSRHHSAARRWLDAALSGADTVGFTWIVLVAFLRISTKVDLFPGALRPEEAMGQVGAWLASPGAVVVDPTRAHLTVLDGLLTGSGTGGNLVNDAHLAAVALEHRADIVSYDTDFTRFPGVRCHRPDDLLGADG